MNQQKQSDWLYALIILLTIGSVLMLLMGGAMLYLHISLSAILESLERSIPPSAFTLVKPFLFA